MNNGFLRNILIVFLYLMLGVFSIFIINIPIIYLSVIAPDFNFIMLLNILLNALYLINYFITIKKLLSIIKTVETTPFVFDNVKRFKVMGYCLCINSIFEFIIGYKGSQNIGNIQILATNSGAITPAMMVCFISALMCFVIAEVFNKAISIKQENDLTI